jgi:hypothetical protein
MKYQCVHFLETIIQKDDETRRKDIFLYTMNFVKQQNKRK